MNNTTNNNLNKNFDFSNSFRHEIVQENLESSATGWDIFSQASAGLLEFNYSTEN